MANSLLLEIEEAERNAESIKTSAAREARDLVKSVEEAVAVGGRQAMKDVYAGVQLTLEEARASANREIAALAARRAAEREKLREKAAARVDAAGGAIFERVVLHGDR